MGWHVVAWGGGEFTSLVLHASDKRAALFETLAHDDLKDCRRLACPRGPLHALYLHSKILNRIRLPESRVRRIAT